MEELNKLFVEINILKEKHKKEDLFNGFMSFGIGADETKHSRFIGMLLNPKGAHKQGEKFLKLFLEHIVCIKEFELKRIRVECEKSTFDNRRIDIAIENEDKIIIIENKFWAIDQPLQLIDYFNYGKAITNGSLHVFIIYLTPYGKPPTIESLGDLDIKNVICVSYEKQITDWLDSCIDSLNGSGDSSLKISLEMYVDLIRNVIKRDKYMNEIYNLLLEDQLKLSTVIDIVNALQGRNFMTDKNFKSFIAQIQEAASKCGVDNPYTEPEDLPETMTYIEIVLENEDQSDIGSICFAKEEIYVKTDDSILSEFNIDTKIITDKNLQNLLNQNSDGVYAWVEQIITKLRQI